LLGKVYFDHLILGRNSHNLSCHFLVNNLLAAEIFSLPWIHHLKWSQRKSQQAYFAQKKSWKMRHCVITVLLMYFCCLVLWCLLLVNAFCFPWKCFIRLRYLAVGAFGKNIKNGRLFFFILGYYSQHCECCFNNTIANSAQILNEPNLLTLYSLKLWTVTTLCSKISGPPASYTPNSVCSSWTSTKYRSLYNLNINYGHTHYDVRSLPRVLSVTSLWRHSLFTLRLRSIRCYWQSDQAAGYPS